MDRKKIPVISFLLLALNVVGFILESHEGVGPMIYRYAMYQGALESGEWERALYSAFLHFDLAHLAANMICLVSFGFTLEKRVGPVKYLAVYAAGIAGSAFLINYYGGYGLHAGASGAIWSLLTATVVYDIRNKRNAAGAFRCVLVNLIYSFSAGVSWQGHIGGGIAGLVIALVMFSSPDPDGRFGGDDPYRQDSRDEQPPGSADWRPQ